GWAASCAWRSPTSTTGARSAWSRWTRRPTTRRPRPTLSNGYDIARRGLTAIGGAAPPGVFRTSLASGLQVVSEHVPGSRSAAVGLWVGAGARDETALQAGAAHFLEHVLFKRTPTRTAAQIAEQVDAVGGELNAFTTKEYTCFYAHVLDRDARLAVDVVTDVALRGLCRADDIELERQVVLEEIAMRDQDPEDLLADLLDEAMFTGHALARPVIGTPESVTAMNRRRITGFHRRRYRPEKMVLAVAGNVDHDTVLRAVTEALADRTDGPTTGPAAPVRPRPRRRPGAIVRDHDGEQAHLS